jgi:hypothetical protein
MENFQVAGAHHGFRLHTLFDSIIIYAKLVTQIIHLVGKHHFGGVPGVAKIFYHLRLTRGKNFLKWCIRQQIHCLLRNIFAHVRVPHNLTFGVTGIIVRGGLAQKFRTKKNFDLWKLFLQSIR